MRFQQVRATIELLAEESLFFVKIPAHAWVLSAALGAVFGGVTVVTWYPITPSSSLVESLIGYLERTRRDPSTGKQTYAVIQAEDEIAAIGMALGAAFGGALGVTATSGPGVCLKSEAIGLAVVTELPCVIIDVQRGGPSTGCALRLSRIRWVRGQARTDASDARSAGSAGSAVIR